MTDSAPEQNRAVSDNSSETRIHIVADTQDKATVLRVSGEIDVLTAPVLREAIETAWSEGPQPPATIVDLTAVTFLASAGLAVLAGCSRSAPESARLWVVADKPATSRPITVTGLSELLNLCTTVDEAFEAV
ncbi:anti-sigma factor antagonist [Nocardia wallacei]|uniref:anti-sigma factor antagonist n=1 Tax=Nocardia wallacei TaxID=480035 RepID=UPI0024575CF2|nr:anti-sigma factor antagonist [Nocardia wallacei]